MLLTSENVNKKLIGRKVSLQIGEIDHTGYIHNVDTNHGYSHINVKLDKAHQFGEGYGSTKDFSCIICPGSDAPNHLTLS